MAVLSIVGSLIGGVLSFAGQMQAAKAQANALNYEAQVKERNARTALQQANADAEDKQLENTRQLSMIRAAYGSNGLQLAGSPLEVITDTALEQSLDVEKIKYQGKLRAQGYTEEAAAARAGAKNAKTAGLIGGLAGLIGGITSAAGTAQKAGMSIAGA